MAITLAASADPGSIFGGWSEGCGLVSICAVTMNANSVITATFDRLYVVYLPIVMLGFE